MVSKVVAVLILLCNSYNGVAASLPKEGLQNPNKPPVKTFQLEGGDTVDCIDFYKQPAFDHPLLKRHKAQKLSQAYLARREEQLKESRAKRKACPSGTVPIPRTTKEDLMIAIPLNHTGISASNARRPHEVFVRLQIFEHIRYHGASGVVSVYNLSVSDNHISTANIWVENGPDGQLNYIIVGWTVGLYKDKNPRLYIYWSVDGGHLTGCYNFECEGFVQVDSEIAPGHLLIPVSIYGGPTYNLKIKIFQDKQTENWLLSVHDEDIVVGYFPKELFPYLKYGARTVAWGGNSYGGNDGLCPPMGSGHKPDGQYNHAAYFRKLMYFDQNFVISQPLSKNTRYFIDGSGCYGLQNGANKGEYWGYNFLFGGPGGDCEK